MSKPEPIASVAQHPEKADQMSKTTIAALKNIKKYAWPNGCILTCPSCLRRSEKTPEQMEKYINKWPRCCNLPADVRPK